VLPSVTPASWQGTVGTYALYDVRVRTYVQPVDGQRRSRRGAPGSWRENSGLLPSEEIPNSPGDLLIAAVVGVRSTSTVQFTTVH